MLTQAGSDMTEQALISPGFFFLSFLCWAFSSHHTLNLGFPLRLAVCHPTFIPPWTETATGVWSVLS